MVEILDPANGPYILDTTVGPATAVYTPNTSADFTGDGDVDDYALYRIPPVLSILDSNAGAPVDFLFSFNIKSGDPNARGYLCSFIDSISHGAKNAQWGCYFEVKDNAPNVLLKFGTVKDGKKVQFSTCVYNTQYWATLRYDPAARTVQVSIYTDAARTTLLLSSPTLDTSAGPDDGPGGAGVFQPISMAARGKGTAPYEYWVGEMDFGGGATLLISGSVSGLSSVSASAGLNKGAAGSAAGTGALSGLAGLSLGVSGTLTGLCTFSAGMGKSIPLGGALSGVYASNGNLALGIGMAGISLGLSASSGGIWLQLVLTGSLTSLSSIWGTPVVQGQVALFGTITGTSLPTGTTGVIYGAAGTSAGVTTLSGVLALQGSILLNGTLNSLSSGTGFAGLRLGMSGFTAGLSGISALAVSGLALSGTTVAVTTDSGLFDIVAAAGGTITSLSSFNSAVFVTRALMGGLGSTSVFTADIATQSVKNITGQTRAFSTFAGAAYTDYGLSGTYLSGLLLSGNIHESISLAGMFSGVSSISGLWAVSGPLSSTTLARSARIDVTRCGGEMPPTVQIDYSRTILTKDNNNPKVTI